MNCVFSRGRIVGRQAVTIPSRVSRLGFFWFRLARWLTGIDETVDWGRGKGLTKSRYSTLRRCLDVFSTECRQTLRGYVDLQVKSSRDSVFDTMVLTMAHAAVLCSPRKISFDSPKVAGDGYEQKAQPHEGANPNFDAQFDVDVPQEDNREC